jgi:hypothetical protein
MNDKTLAVAALMLAITASSAALGDGAKLRRSDHAITWSQSLELLKNKGYAHPLIIQSATVPGNWIGSASKDGHRVDVAIDALGNVSQH